MAEYFHDSQIRRFIIQFAKIFSEWHVTRGNDANGNPILIRIPVMYGDSSRMVSAIIGNNSASSLPSAPLLTYYISGIEYDQSRTQEPFHVDSMHVRQRRYNNQTNSFEQVQGQAFTIERPMPVPYTLRLTLDLWTSNYNQKLEFIEQVGTLFNPSLEIQSSDNYIDWTALSVVYQDGITFTSKQVPSGTSNSIDILTWKFYIPIWISQPVRMIKQNVVGKIINSIRTDKALNDVQDDELILGTRQKLTPYGYKMLLIGNKLQLYPNNSPMYLPNSDLELPEPQDTRILWSAVLNEYGVIRPGISQIWIQNPYMETQIVGTIDYDQTDDRLLTYNIDVDTLPQDTLTAINAVINPRTTVPTPTIGQRYLITQDIGVQSSTVIVPGSMLGGSSPVNDMRFIITEVDSTGSILSIDNFIGFVGSPGTYIINLTGSAKNAQIILTVPAGATIYDTVTYSITSGGSGFASADITAVWGNLVAKANDIVQWDGTKWFVSYSSVNSNENGNIDYVTNMSTGVQYRYAEGVWMKSVDGWYEEGDYSIVI